MSQRVRRSERKARQRSGDRGFRYRRPLASFAPLLRDLYPLDDVPPKPWPSPATVEVVVMAGHFPRRRPVTLSLRAPKSRGEIEAKHRAVSKLRLSEGEAYRLCRVGPVKPDGVPGRKGLRSLAYARSPLLDLIRREAADE